MPRAVPSLLHVPRTNRQKALAGYRQVVALSLEFGGLRQFKPRAHWRIQPIDEMRQLVSGGRLLRSLYGDEGGTGSRFHHGQPETSALGGRI